MINLVKETLWKQFGASIDMLENAIQMCPARHWDTEKKFWYNAYHCMFYLDYYLALDPENFSPPAPFTLSEFDYGKMPELVYTKNELISYLQYSREKCHQLLAELTDETANKRWVNRYRDYSVLEMLLYNMRHVQHHTAQLNLILRQTTDNAPPWVSQTKINL